MYWPVNSNCHHLIVYDNVTVNVEYMASASPTIIRQDQKCFKVLIQEITPIEGLKDYVKVHTINETFITHNSMNGMMKELNSASFIRVQKSFIINLRHFLSLEGNIIRLSQVQLGKTYRETFLKRFKEPL